MATRYTVKSTMIFEKLLLQAVVTKNKTQWPLEVFFLPPLDIPTLISFLYLALN